MQTTLFEEDPEFDNTLLESMAGQAQACRRCILHESRIAAVFGEGQKEPSIAFVGEAPGAVEDQTGRPFVGPSGELLDKMIEAIGLHREDLYVCNIVCCRPPENRKPEPEEILACKRYLFGQLELVNPRVIVALGATAAQVLLRTPLGVKSLRGEWHVWNKKPVRVTFHPAFLLRAPAAKKQTWDDLQAVVARLDASTSEAARGIE